MNEFFEMPEKSDKRGFLIFDNFEGLSEALLQCGCRKLQVREVGWKFDTSLPQEVRDAVEAAKEGIKDGSIVVKSYFDGTEDDYAALLDTVG